MGKLTVALAGNPNCGKTTLFNALTGATQRVGNWPGVTVERLEGFCRHGDAELMIVDLPGIYSFSAFSVDEKVSREFILKDKPDVVINIIDATNLERNLYLTTQLLEMRVPVVVALNMMDIAKTRKIKIEVDHLRAHLGCPVIPMVASRREGLDQLKDELIKIAESHAVSPTRVEYDREAETAIAKLSKKLRSKAGKAGVDARWLAIKLLEGDELAEQLVEGSIGTELKTVIQKVEHHVGDDIDVVIADGRYGFIHGLAKDVCKRTDQLRKTVSDAIDRVVLSRVFGIPIFLTVMYGVFMLTINVGGAFIDFFDILFGTIFVDGFGALLSALHVPDLLITLLAGGVGGGIQTVATFVPPIFFIFLCLSALEDSGYMARAAFVMDRVLRAIGLPGKAFLPMLVGFGCNVPGIMAARTLENERDRTMAVMMNPFMSCGARLPVYILFAAAFFPRSGSTLIFGLYMTGILFSVLTGLLLRKTLLRGQSSTFVMELPPYHIPTFNGVFLHTWNKLKSFAIRAGKVIVMVVVILSLLNTIGTDGSFGHEDSSDSVLSAIGKSITPVFYPMGIEQDNWPATVGLFTGIFAKEAVVGTLDALYTQLDVEEAGGGAEEEPFDFFGGISEAFASVPAAFEGFSGTFADPIGIGGASGVEDSEAVAEEMEIHGGTLGTMQKAFGSKAAAIAYLLFILIYAPCVAAIAAVYRETSWKWAVFCVSYLTGLAWIAATLYYQIATFTAHPGSSSAWVGGIVLFAAVFVGVLYKCSGRSPEHA
ncbi:Fe(2+) transporter permease subunit FeoB [Tichowtungia aerotolerans]|uniref:Ferrous iron transport protein B n=1 Tax=Tichowtungia aerotolerans TaxID=2697043 RepID=A0A6P1M3A8_9BACT|nr:Fe(2+) transporter permease subunit FeoB [Tichowtungia aerotolerans]QHI68301.1 Fe(2+) transporter permease subunit FeoB [Tichowtungia aerotolerans]